MRTRNVIMVMLLLISLNAFAQENKELSSSSSPRWSISLSFGATMLGPASDIENAMRRDGFSKLSGSFFGGTIYYPYSNRELSWLAKLTYDFNPPFALSVFVGHTNFGQTVGMADIANRLSIESSTIIIAPVISISEYKFLRIGIGVGPALYIIKAKESEDFSNSLNSEYDQNKIGFIIDFGIRFFGETGIFAGLNVQFRKVGKMEIGPFTAEYLNSIEVLQRTSVKYDHPFFGLTIGVQL